LTVSRFFLQESGFISAADNGIKDLLLNADYRVWQHATCLLKKAKLMPGGCFTLELTSTAPPCDAINTMEEIKKSRDEKFEFAQMQTKLCSTKLFLNDPEP
jgi:hypothetical protein